MADRTSHESGPSFYEILGVSSDASDAAISAAFREASKTAHPDVGGTSGQFRMLIYIRDTLIDSDRRRAYDESLITTSTANGRSTTGTVRVPQLVGLPFERAEEQLAELSSSLEVLVRLEALAPDDPRIGLVVRCWPEADELASGACLIVSVGWPRLSGWAVAGEVTRTAARKGKVLLDRTFGTEEERREWRAKEETESRRATGLELFANSNEAVLNLVEFLHTGRCRRCGVDVDVDDLVVSTAQRKYGGITGTLHGSYPVSVLQCAACRRNLLPVEHPHNPGETPVYKAGAQWLDDWARVISDANDVAQGEAFRAAVVRFQSVTNLPLGFKAQRVHSRLEIGEPLSPSLVARIKEVAYAARNNPLTPVDALKEASLFLLSASVLAIPLIAWFHAGQGDDSSITEASLPQLIATCALSILVSAIATFVIAVWVGLGERAEPWIASFLVGAATAIALFVQSVVTTTSAEEVGDPIDYIEWGPPVAMAITWIVSILYLGLSAQQVEV